ncbi:MAG: hypothetical protein QXQ87_04625 [Halobacteria archaeon]
MDKELVIAVEDDMLVEYLRDYANLQTIDSKALERFKEWVLADIHEWLKDNARSLGDIIGAENGKWARGVTK